MTTVTITLPESLKEYVAKQVKSRRYGDTSQYFRKLLRQAKEQQEADERLEALLIAGLDSGKEIEITPEYWGRKKEAIMTRVRQRKQLPTR
jgi:antitoxin ParD1/3/4